MNVIEVGSGDVTDASVLPITKKKIYIRELVYM